MSINFSKNKEKRLRSSHSGANNSFVQNVASRMSGLLPATITKWFSSPSSSNANGSAPMADATDSSTEDEATERSITQPPAKRMRYNSTTKYNHHGTTETNTVTSSADTVEPYSSYSTIQSPPGRTTFRRETNFVSTPLRSPTSESTMEKSDKECSTMFKSQHTISSVGRSIGTKRKSLFGNNSENNAAAKKASVETSSNTVRDLRQPYFKPSLLGSPFYSSRTMYGGAASSYINQPNIKQRKVTLVNESSNNDNNTMSHSARRVLDLLENYSSPLTEAKRISTYLKNYANDSMNSSLDASTSKLQPRSNKYQELHVPSMVSILRLKQKSRLMDTTNAARQIIASHSSSVDLTYPTPVNKKRNQDDTSTKESSHSLITKVKSRLTRPKRGDDAKLEHDIAAPVNLPSAVLQIDQNNLPKFTLGYKMDSRSSVVTTVAETTSTMFTTESKSTFDTSTKTTETLSKLEVATSDNTYKFSSPLRVSTHNDALQNVSTFPKFTFGSPDRSIEKEKVTEKKKADNSYFVDIQKVSEETCKSEDQQCDKINVGKSFSFGIKQGSKDSDKSVKCSVCKFANSQPHIDKCMNCEKVPVNNLSNVSLSKTADSSKWTCEDCWVNSDANAEKCIACGGKNPSKNNAVKNTSTNSIAATDPLESEWKCNDCWIKNKSNVDKCVACGGAKQTTTPTPVSSSVFKPPDSSIINIVKTAKDKWECPCCLVRNDGSETKCVCCDTARPGIMSESENNKFKFSTVPNTTFKFGIDSKIQEAAFTKSMIDTKTNVETNNNILPKTVTFTFNASTEDKTDTTKEINNVPKMNFTFGIPKDISASQITPILKTNKNLPESTIESGTEIKDKPEEVQKVDLTPAAALDAPKPVQGLIASSTTCQIGNNQPNISVPVLETPINTEKKEAAHSLITTITSQPAGTSEAPQQRNTFTFSGANIKPAVNFAFGSPASTTASTSISFAAPIPLNTPVTSTVSLFQNSKTVTTSTVQSPFQTTDLATTSTVSLFQKTDTTATTTAPLPLVAPAPSLFSFGTNTQMTQPMNPEKSNFNFKFGNSNSTETALFKPSFSATTDKVDSAVNKFVVPTGGNTLGTGLASAGTLSGSIIGTGNGLPSGNTLIGTYSLPAGNGLSSNPITGNGLSTGNGFQPGAISSAPSGGIFGAPMQKENMWPATNNNAATNLFVSNASTNVMQKPAAFTFGSSTPFNANSSTTAFGSSQSTVNVFGIGNQSTSGQPSLFSSPAASQSTSSTFGAPQQASNAAPALGIFGTPSVGATPPFGAPNPSIPTFEAPSHPPAPTPAGFNFGAAQTSPMFGFGQQQQQPQQSSVYNFGGAAAGGTPQVQFNMGSATNMAGRRMRKAVRRNPPR